MIIEICPVCSSPGLEVEKVTVEFFTNNESLKESRFYACCNQSCNIAYFSKDKTILCNQLISPLWYKDSSLNTPVCYCSNISRFEVYQSVYSYGAKTISDVQKILNKNRTGFCKEENPIGGCCKNVFIYSIEQAKKLKKQSLVKCPHCNFEEFLDMSFDNCIISHKCNSCGKIMTPREGECCIFCSYGSEKCPTKQLKIIL